MNEMIDTVWKWMADRAQIYMDGYLVLASQREVAAGTGLCLTNAHMALRALAESGRVQPLRPGVYYIPGIIFGGVE